MPELPPLVGHLKADAGDWDTKMEMVAATGGEAAAVIDILHEAYDGARTAALEDAEANHVLRDATVESATATELLGHLLNVARDHAMESAASNAWLARSLKEVRDAAAESSVAVEANSAAKTGNAAASAAATGAGFPFMGVLYGIGAAALVAATPIIALGVGLAGLVATLGLATVGMVGFGAIAVLAANGTGQVGRQVAQLQHVLQGAANTLGKELAPAARMFLELLDQLVPMAVAAVRPVIDGFTLLATAITPFLHVLAGQLFGALTRTGLLFVDFTRSVMAMGPQVQRISQLLLDLGVQTIAGLLSNLLRLTDWFLVVLPSLQGPTGGFFSLLGTLVQVAASAIARFTEWVSQHWPEIARFFTQSAQEIAAGFAYVSPVIGVAIAALQRLQPVIQFIKQHADELKPILYGLGGALAVAAAIAVMTATTVIVLGAAFVGLFLVGDKVVNWLKVEVPAGIRAAGAAFSSLGTHMRLIQGWLTGTLAFIRAWISSIVATIEEGWAEFTSRPFYWVGVLIGWLNGKLNELLRNVQTWIVQMLVNADRWADDMTKRATLMAVKFIAAVGVELFKLPFQIADWLGATVPKVLAWAGDLAVKGGKAALDFSVALAKEWQKLPDQMWTLGVNIVKGIIGGIGSMLGAAVKAAKDLISGVIDGANAAAGHPHSPAPATVPLGMALAQGVEAGVGHGAPGARAAMAGLVTSMTGIGPSSSGTTALARVAGSPDGLSMDDTNELLSQLYQLLDERLPRGSGAVFSNAAYRPV